MNNNYDDIINLPHHESKTRKRMSMYDRAFQFAPFSALVGYDDEVKEAGRTTNKKIEIDTTTQSILNSKLQVIKNNIKTKPLITFTYFVKDSKKEGGKYITITNNVKIIDEVYDLVILTDGTKININDIIDIEGDMLDIS